MFLAQRLLPTFAKLRAPRSFEAYMLLAVLVAGAVAMSPNIADPDLWGHVQYGRDMLQNGLAKHTSYSYLAEHELWVNHEILAELGLAIGMNVFGQQGLTTLKLLAGFFLLAGILWTARRHGIAALSACVILLATGAGIARFWSLRPQLFSFLAYAALLFILSWMFRDWECKWQMQYPFTWKKAWFKGTLGNIITYNNRRLKLLWCMPLLFAIWANTHGGFLAGLCVYTAYLGLRSLELLSQRGWQSLGLIRRFALMLLGAWAAPLLNPYGVGYVTWLWQDLRVPRPEIVEWLPPNLMSSEAFPFVCCAVLAMLALLFTKRSRDFTHVVILGLTFWQALSHERHIPFFVLSCAFFLPVHIDSLFQRFKIVSTCENPIAFTPRTQSNLLFGLALACCVVGYKISDRLTNLKVMQNDYPVQAFEYIAQRKLQGRMVCCMNWAQYAIYTFGNAENRIQIHVDGRLRTAYSQTMLDQHFDFILGNQSQSERYRDPHTVFNATRAIREKNPNLVLIDRRQPHAVTVMNEQTRHWVLLYQDALSQLWGRRSWYDDSHSPAYIVPENRDISNFMPTGSVAWPALPACLPRK
jgi:hypothetical protein